VFLKAEDAFLDVRAAKGSDKKSDDWCWHFFDVLVPCIAGKKIWTSQMKVLTAITDSNCIIVL
jgi:hypothetical protein